MPAIALSAIDTWRQLLEPPSSKLLAAVNGCERIEPTLIARLRRDYPADLVAAGVELVGARRKAEHKFPAKPDLVADVTGVEQATSACVADFKARRFAEAGAPRVFDLCCGIGGDAMALAQVAEVVAIDLDPLRAWMARRNAACAAVAADVTRLPISDTFFHLDPSRRDARARRRWHYADYIPGPDFITELLRRCPDGAIKMGPGVDMDALPRGEIEIIAERGSLVQAVLWTGRLAREVRTATRLPAGETISGVPRPVPVGESARFLLAVHPAVERADLMGWLAEQLGVAAIHPQLGLLTAESPVHSPWLTCFESIEQLPWHLRHVKQWLAAHGAGIVEVKTRGGAVDANAVQNELRGEGTIPFTVFVLRAGQKKVAYITRRVPA